MGSMNPPQTSAELEASQQAGLIALQAAVATPYATAALIESTAPLTANYVYAVDTNTTYTLVAIGSLTVDHVTVLAALGTSSFVWKAINGLNGPNIPQFTDATEPDAASVPNLLWFNSTSGTYRYSNGSTVIDLGTGIDPAIDDGLTIVFPNYVPTDVSGVSAFQINSTSKFAFITLPSEIDHADFAFGLYLAVKATGGNIYLDLFEVGTDDKPTGAAVASWHDWDCSSATAATYIRKAFSTAQQRQRNKRYGYQIGVASGVDISLAYQRQRTGTESGLYQGVKCFTSTDGGAGHTWTALTQDSRDAQFLFMLNPSANVAPQACYGRYRGKNVSLVENGYWKNYEIPEDGVVWNIESGFVAGTTYNFFLYSNSGVLAIEGSATGTVIHDGHEVQSGAAQYRFLGMFYGITRNSQVALIFCESRLSIVNLHGRKVGLYRQPYGGTTFTSNQQVAAWRKFQDNDDYTVPFICLDKIVDVVIQTGIPTTQYQYCGIGIDSTVLQAPQSNTGQSSATSTGHAHACLVLPRGQHVLYALESTDNYSVTIYYWYAFQGGALTKTKACVIVQMEA